ncbi:zf-TFIIB domain-containing protein [Archangium lansingense]|uniref:Zf-TFIIB domain-containing protein n=1 Tax=Archangium lansingense TaxID=2995310 RepID=A0ABT4APG7_9BACT|nr:zf-TFIIB domain-containing protein [Archangium lansinium]MCY1083592.1 zf-TFIIB domain-containing protein [Archangium lansinium]
MKCPECKGQMAEQSFEARDGRQVTLDVCHTCRGLWFDTHESLQLSPSGTLRLFRELYERSGERRHRDHRPLSCPRCDSKLEMAHDMARNNRFQYSRCTQQHGHFITFFQFLREKGIARDLTPRELTELRKHVDTLLCSDCGEPVRLANLTACVRCQAPLSLLDPECVENTVRGAQKPDGSRRDVAPEVAARLLMSELKLSGFNPRPQPRDKPEHRSNAIPPVTLNTSDSRITDKLRHADDAVDLIELGIWAVGGSLRALARFFF